MTPAEARSRFASARVARLASADPSGQPHLVPIVFVLDGETVYSAVDAKPKRTTHLRRLENVAANPRVCLLVDHYTEQWSELWWVRADGTARVIDPAAAEAHRAVELLAERYPQQRADGPVLAVEVRRWSYWSAS